MKIADIRTISAGVLFIFIIASGLWLTKSGRPLNAAIFTVHKLIALIALIIMIIIVRTPMKGISLESVGKPVFVEPVPGLLEKDGLAD
jgi:hypothetical protein